MNQIFMMFTNGAERTVNIDLLYISQWQKDLFFLKMIKMLRGLP